MCVGLTLKYSVKVKATILSIWVILKSLILKLSVMVTRSVFSVQTLIVQCTLQANENNNRWKYHKINTYVNENT